MWLKVATDSAGPRAWAQVTRGGRNGRNPCVFEGGLTNRCLDGLVMNCELWLHIVVLWARGPVPSLAKSWASPRVGSWLCLLYSAVEVDVLMTKPVAQIRKHQPGWCVTRLGRDPPAQLLPLIGNVAAWAAPSVSLSPEASRVPTPDSPGQQAQLTVDRASRQR